MKADIIIVNCPECNAPVEPEDDLEIGEAVECDQCEALLVVTSTDPLEFALDEGDEEDSDEDDEDEGDDEEDEDDNDDFEEDGDEEDE